MKLQNKIIYFNSRYFLKTKDLRLALKRNQYFVSNLRLMNALTVILSNNNIFIVTRCTNLI